MLLARLRVPIRRGRLALFALGLLGLAGPGAAAEPEPIRVKVLGGLATISQYVRYEAPFWSERVPQLTGGRLIAEIAPFDRSGVRGQEMLQLMRLGVVPFGTVLLALAAADEPELNGIDLPVLSPDIATLRQTVAAWRPRVARLLRERYGLQVLAVYTYPAQVLFCRTAFAGLGDLAGRRVRVSSVGQAELLAALAATPLVLPFAETVAAVRGDVVDCAVTGTLSANAVGLHTLMTHVSRIAISWGVTVFAANQAAWDALPADLRETLRAGLGKLEGEIWAAAERETEDGFACNAGRPECLGGERGRMIIVAERPEDAARRRDLLGETVLPAWIRRCGDECVAAWNDVVGPRLGLIARPE